MTLVGTSLDNGAEMDAWQGPTPHPQKLTIAPIFKADSVTLAVLREKDGPTRDHSP